MIVDGLQQPPTKLYPFVAEWLGAEGLVRDQRRNT
jgi:hypothetical protein